MSNFIEKFKDRWVYKLHKRTRNKGGFLNIWIRENVGDDYRADDVLNDNQYIAYRIWRQLNDTWLYKHYLPNTRVFSGSAGVKTKMVFHGGCLSCDSQAIKKLSRCKGCQYFRADWSKPDLKLNGEEYKKEILRAKLKDFVNG